MKLYRINKSAAKDSEERVDPQLIREWNIGNRPVHVIDEVEYMPTQHMGEDRLYKIPIASIEAGWQKDKDFYFGVGDEGVIGRRKKFREWRKKNIPIEVPEIHIDSNGTVYFINGRHRFAEMRDE